MVPADPAGDPGADHRLADVNLLRAIATLFGVQIEQSRYYTFMASVKLRWSGSGRYSGGRSRPPDRRTPCWPWTISINPRPGARCSPAKTPRHAAKTNQSQYPWAQTIVTVACCKIHGRWCCLPLAFAFYLRRATLRARCLRVGGQAVSFRPSRPTVRLIRRLAGVFRRPGLGGRRQLVQATTACSRHGHKR